MVTHPVSRDALRVVTSKLTLRARPWLAVPLVRAVTTVIGAVTLPADGDTAVVITTEISQRVTCHLLTALLVAVVDAVIGAVTSGPLRNTAVVCLARELSVLIALVVWTHAGFKWFI